jgi:outer membrane autotransporter protein
MPVHRSAFVSKKNHLALAIALNVLNNPAAVSGTLVREQATVRPGHVEEQWTLHDGSLLTVEPGGRTQSIRSEGSTVLLTGAQVRSNLGDGLFLNGSEANVTDSNIYSNNGTGLNVGPRSTAAVHDSQIVGLGRGVNAALGGIVALHNTSVRGMDDGNDGIMGGGVGVVQVEGDVQLRDNTDVVGDKHGVLIVADPGESSVSNLYVEGSHVRGIDGSAIKVAAPRSTGIPHANIEISNGTTLTAGNGVILEVTNGATADMTVMNSVLQGDIHIGDGSTASVTLGSQALLAGATHHLTRMNLRSDSLWTLTRNSTVKSLAMGGGRIDLGGSKGDLRELRVDTLEGHGTFGIGTDLAAGMGDRVVVSGEARGSHHLAVTNTGADVAKGQPPLEVINTGGGDALFDVIGGQVDLGTYVYDLQKQGNDWFLVQRPGEVVAPGTRSVLGLFSAAPTVWYGEASTLRSRMGELRMGSGEGGVWSRAYGNRYDVSAGGGFDYQQTQQGVSMGADGALALDSGRMLLGVTGGYSRSDLDLAAGTTGSVDSYYLGLYGTWLADDGYYIDALMKLNRFQNEADVSMSDGQRSAGNYNNHGVGVSGEVGKRFELDDGVFVSPFAQVSALWVQGEKYSLDNGMQARSNKADSLLGKVGTQVGQTHQIDSGGRFDYYAKAALAHEFAENNQVKVNGNRFSNDLSGSRAELGIGAAVQLSDRLQLHTDLEYAKGRNMEQPWGLSLGARYDF